VPVDRRRAHARRRPPFSSTLRASTLSAPYSNFREPAAAESPPPVMLARLRSAIPSTGHPNGSASARRAPMAASRRSYSARPPAPAPLRWRTASSTSRTWCPPGRPPGTPPVPGRPRPRSSEAVTWVRVGPMGPRRVCRASIWGGHRYVVQFVYQIPHW
jgi:hypothetical protein